MRTSLFIKMKKNNKFYILFLLIIVTFITRFIGINNPHNFTFDEVLYAQLAAQLKENPLSYTSEPIYKYNVNRGRPLPDHYNRPLYVHPPLFSYLISIAYLLFAQNYLVALLVSLFFGIVIIIVTFILGAYIFNKNVGLLAAFLLALDPIHWLCSQKIWIEATVTAFIWISLFFIIKAIKESNYKYFYLAGVATGCSILTKYTGFLIFPIGLSLIFMHNRKILKSGHFWSWPLISSILFIPWLLWNYIIYRGKFLVQLINPHGRIIQRFQQLDINWYMVIIAILIFIIIYLYFKKQSRRKIFLNFVNSIKLSAVMIGIALILLFTRPYMLQGLINMFDFGHIPATGCKMAMFAKEPWYFYLRRLLELSPFYIFSFGSILFLIKPKEGERTLITASIWILVFAILWRNFQCRYVFPVVPGLLLISSRTVIWVGFKLKEWSKSKLILLIYRIIFVYILLLFLCKTLLIDLFIALPNRACYF